MTAAIGEFVADGPTILAESMLLTKANNSHCDIAP